MAMGAKSFEQAKAMMGMFERYGKKGMKTGDNFGKGKGVKS